MDQTLRDEAKRKTRERAERWQSQTQSPLVPIASESTRAAPFDLDQTQRILFLFLMTRGPIEVDCRNPSPSRGHWIREIH